MHVPSSPLPTTHNHPQSQKGPETAIRLAKLNIKPPISEPRPSPPPKPKPLCQESGSNILCLGLGSFFCGFPLPFPLHPISYHTQHAVDRAQPPPPSPSTTKGRAQFSNPLKISRASSSSSLPNTFPPLARLAIPTITSPSAATATAVVERCAFFRV